jgi:hypothetical protein
MNLQDIFFSVNQLNASHSITNEILRAEYGLLPQAATLQFTETPPTNPVSDA